MTIEEPIWVDEVKNSDFDLSDLPSDIESQISDYLDLEFMPEENISIKYIGEYELWGKPIKCWDFGSSEAYATVQPYADSFYIGITSKVVAVQ